MGIFFFILDNIRDRDDDDPTGNKPKKKSAKKDDSEGDEKTPLDGIAKTTTQIVGAGMGAMLGIGVMKGMSGLMNMDKWSDHGNFFGRIQTHYK